MQKVYVLQAQGWGDDEDCFYNVSVHTTEAGAQAKILALRAEMLEDIYDTVYNVDVLEVDA